MARLSEQTVIEFSMSRYPPLLPMSGNPPLEARLVVRDPKDGPLVDNPMLALAVGIAVLFSVLVGTAFIRCALSRRRRKKGEPMMPSCDIACVGLMVERAEAKEQEKQDHWQANGKARGEAPTAYVQPTYPARRWGSSGQSGGDTGRSMQNHMSAVTVFQSETSSLQTASDAAVRGSPSPSLVLSPPPAIVTQSMLHGGQGDSDAHRSRTQVPKNLLPSV